MIKKLLVVFLLLSSPAMAQRTQVTTDDHQAIKAGRNLSTINDTIYVGGANYPLTAAGINAALASCMLGPGKVVLPPGTITITATLVMTGQTCDLEGAGRNVTVLQMVDPTNNLIGIILAGYSRVEHLTLVGTGAGACGYGGGGSNTALGITGGNLPNVTINDVEVSGFACQLINSGVGSTNWTITNNYVHDGGNEGILYGTANRGILSGNTIYNNAFNGIDIGGSSLVTITGNVIYQNGGAGVPGLDHNGITLYAASDIGTGVSVDNVISGNVVFGNNTHGILVQSGPGGQIRETTITGNDIFDNGIGNGSTQVWGDGIVLINDTTNGLMHRNTIVGNTVVSNSRHGINIESNSSLTSAFDETLISSNQIELNGSGTYGGYGVVIYGSGDPYFTPADTIIKNNIMLNNTTGAFLDGINGIPGTRTELDGNRTQTLSASFEVQSPILALGYPAGISGTGACATITAQTGGSWAGSFTCAGPAGTSTVTITPGITAPNGWVCNASDNTTRANLPSETSYSGTACVLSMTSTLAGDVITWSATAF